MSKKTKIICGMLLVVGLIAGWRWYLGSDSAPDRQLYSYIKRNPELGALYNKAIAKEKEIAKTPDKPTLYFDAGLYWKSIAEQSSENQRPFFEKSLLIYERGIEKFGQNNILFYLNGGKLAERLEDYAKAERYYKQAVKISPADESGYLALVDLYYYKLKLPKEDILAVFDVGMSSMINTVPLVSGRASYLRRIGEYAAALKDYRTLSKVFPQNAGYKEIIQELQSQLAK